LVTEQYLSESGAAERVIGQPRFHSDREPIASEFERLSKRPGF